MLRTAGNVVFTVEILAVFQVHEFPLSSFLALHTFLFFFRCLPVLDECFSLFELLFRDFYKLLIKLFLAFLIIPVKFYLLIQPKLLRSLFLLLILDLLKNHLVLYPPLPSISAFLVLIFYHFLGLPLLAKFGLALDGNSYSLEFLFGQISCYYLS